MGDNIRITMFAFDGNITKRFNRLFLENFIKHPNCDNALWEKLRVEVDKKPYKYTVKDNTMLFQVCKLEIDKAGFIIIWGYNLNDEDVNNNDFKSYVNNICKSGVKIVNRKESVKNVNVKPSPVINKAKQIRPTNNDDIVCVPNAKSLEEYGWKQENSNSNTIVKYEKWDGGGEHCDCAYFDLETNVINVIVSTCTYLLPEYKQAMRNRAKELGMTNVIFTGAPAPDYPA